MKVDDVFVITKTISIENGQIPSGAVVKILDILETDSKFLVSITPFIHNNIRETHNLIIDNLFLESFTTK